MLQLTDSYPTCYACKRFRASVGLSLNRSIHCKRFHWLNQGVLLLYFVGESIIRGI